MVLGQDVSVKQVCQLKDQLLHLRWASVLADNSRNCNAGLSDASPCAFLGFQVWYQFMLGTKTKVSSGKQTLIWASLGKVWEEPASRGNKSMSGKLVMPW